MKHLLEEVEKIREDVEKLMGEKFVVNKHIQDASFLCEIRAIEPTLSNQISVKTSFPRLALTFSNFGRLVTMWGSGESLHPNHLNQLAELLDLKGFTYVPIKYLEAEYTGRHSFLKGGTWMDRFFSYL